MTPSSGRRPSMSDPWKEFVTVDRDKLAKAKEAFLASLGVQDVADAPEDVRGCFAMYFQMTAPGNVDAADFSIGHPRAHVAHFAIVAAKRSYGLSHAAGASDDPGLAMFLHELG